MGEFVRIAVILQTVSRYKLNLNLKQADQSRFYNCSFLRRQLYGVFLFHWCFQGDSKK